MQEVMADVTDSRVGDRGALGHVGGGLVVAAFGDRFREQFGEAALDVFQVDAVFRLFRAGDAGAHRRQVEFNDLRVVDFTFFRNTEHALRLEIGLNGVAMLFTAGHAVILKGRLVDGEEAAGRAVVGRHVGDGGAIGCRQR